MSKVNKRQSNLSEDEIDEIVIDQANDASEWEEPVHVRRTMTSLAIPADLAARAAFLAQLHRIGSLDDWVATIVQERVELEEAAFTEVKRALTVQAA